MTYSRVKEKPEAAQHFIMCAPVMCCSLRQQDKLRSWTVGEVDGSGSGRAVGLVGCHVRAQV